MAETNELHCLRCDHLWVPRVERPKACPNCKQPRWWKPADRPDGMTPAQTVKAK